MVIIWLDGSTFLISKAKMNIMKLITLTQNTENLEWWYFWYYVVDYLGRPSNYRFVAYCIPMTCHSKGNVCKSVSQWLREGLPICYNNATTMITMTIIFDRFGFWLSKASITLCPSRRRRYRPTTPSQTSSTPSYPLRTSQVSRRLHRPVEDPTCHYRPSQASRVLHESVEYFTYRPLECFTGQ